MDQVYSDLYDMVEHKMQEHGCAMASTKDTFMTILHTDTSVLDGLQVENLDNMAFLETAYVVLMKRLPDKQAKEYWGYFAGKYTQEKFRSELLGTLIDSKECIAKGGTFVNNVIIPRKAMDWNNLNITDDGSGQQDPEKQSLEDRLYKVYPKLPLKLRIALHKIRNRG